MEVNTNRTDPSQNFIERYPHSLDSLFLPKTVAVIGAKDNPGSVARTILVNLMTGHFGGSIYPINPKRDQVLGLTTYPSVKEVPESIDLAIIVTPAATVPGVMAECVQAKVKSVIIISAGFKELGESGLKLEQEAIAYAKQANIPVIGPNCLGVMNPIYGLNATFARGMALSGNLAFISQSGAMCTAVLDWSLREQIGFSAFISIGSMADVNWGTLIDYLGDDPHTQSLLLYMETIGDARSFLTAAREVALEKPIIVIKAGRSQAAAKAAASHTGSLAGSDEVFDAALERVGVLRVESISELFSIASVLSRQPLPKGPRLSIVTNAGGPAVLATDATVLNQAELTELEPKTIGALNDVLPSAWSHSNPIDILGDADAKRYVNTIEILAQDTNSDGTLVILSPQDMTDATKTAEGIVPFSHYTGKPMLASWMGGDAVKDGVEILGRAQIPTFSYPDDAAKAFATMWRYSENLRRLYETPAIKEASMVHDPHKADQRQKEMELLFNKIQSKGRSLLTEFESKKVLTSYHIPTVKTCVATTAEDAIKIANSFGYPIVVKLYSQTITHKTDVGGVKLNLKDADEVAKAFEDIRREVSLRFGKENFSGVTVQRMIKSVGYELILGSTTDPQFGPVLLFGMGGQLVEVFKDRALGLPPLNHGLARHLMEKTNIYEALKGVRGRKAINMHLLEEILIHFSQMIIENPRIKECDINPLLASEEEIIALDARIVLHDPEISEKELPKLAIRPYPINYVKQIYLKNRQTVILRPIIPEDEPLMVAFHRELSEDSVRQRYFEFVSLDDRVAHDRLIRICFTDYDREWAIVAELKDEHQKKMIIGLGRLSRIQGTNRSQLKLTIVDAYHHLGLGTQLIQCLLEIARKEKIAIVDAYILCENEGMLKICKRLGFKMTPMHDPAIIHAEWTAIE